MLHGNHLLQTVSEITSLWEASLWRHFPGESKPSDTIARGASILKLGNNALWWNRPGWLKLPQEKWPVNSSLEISKTKAEEARKKVVHVSAAVIKDPVIVDPSKYSKWSKLLRVTFCCQGLCISKDQNPTNSCQRIKG